MMKIFLLLIMISFNLYAEGPVGFNGCGVYSLKGSLIKKDPFHYVVNPETNSKMEFSIKGSDDLVLISSYLDVPTEILAEISKTMDGTRGDIHNISKVSLRKLNPLEPTKNSGITLVTPKPCSK